MIKEATLFTVHSHTLAVHDNYFTLMHAQQPMTRVSGKYLEADVIREERLPIHHIKKIEHGKWVDDYIAIHPELREILEAPLREDLFVMNSRLGAALCLNQSYTDRISEFNALPWYRRIFRRV